MENNEPQKAIDALFTAFERQSTPTASASTAEKLFQTFSPAATSSGSAAAEASSMEERLQNLLNSIHPDPPTPASEFRPNSDQQRIKQLEKEKQELEQKLLELQERFYGSPLSEMDSQTLIMQYDQAERQESLLELSEMEALFPDFMAFLRPYLNRYPELELSEVADKIPLKEKKKFVTDLWNNHQDKIKELLLAKAENYRTLAHLAPFVHQLSAEKFSEFARQLIETRYLNSLSNAAENLKRVTLLSQQNGKEEHQAGI